MQRFAAFPYTAFIITPWGGRGLQERAEKRATGVREEAGAGEAMSECSLTWDAAQGGREMLCAGRCCSPAVTSVSQCLVLPCCFLFVVFVFFSLMNPSITALQKTKFFTLS